MSNMENIEKVNFYELFNEDLSILDVSSKEGFFDFIQKECIDKNDYCIFENLTKLRICSLVFDEKSLKILESLLMHCPKLEHLAFRGSKLQPSQEVIGVKKTENPSLGLYNSMLILLTEVIKEGGLPSFKSIDIKKDKDRLGTNKNLIEQYNTLYYKISHLCYISAFGTENGKKTELNQDQILDIENGKIVDFRKKVKPALISFLESKGINNYKEKDMKVFVSAVIKDFEEQHKLFEVNAFISAVIEKINNCLQKLNKSDNNKAVVSAKNKTKSVKTDVSGTNLKKVKNIEESDKKEIISSDDFPKTLVELKALKVKLEKMISMLQQDLEQLTKQLSNSVLDIKIQDCTSICDNISKVKQKQQHYLSGLNEVNELEKSFEANLKEQQKLLSEFSSMKTRIKEY